MPNPHPTQTPEFLEKQFKPKGAESLGKVIGVRFPLAIDALLQALPDKTDFIRQAVAEKLEREQPPSVKAEPAEQAIAPKTTSKSRRLSSTMRAVVTSVKDEPDDELKPEQLIHNPAGWRGWVDKALGGDRYAVTFENGLKDEYPRHLLRVPEGERND